MSLKVKTALFFSLLLLVVVGSLSTALVRSAARALARDQADQARKRSAALAKVCHGALFSQQDLMAVSYLHHLKGDPDILEAFCVDKDARIIGHTDTERLGEPAGEKILRALAVGRGPSWTEEGRRAAADTPLVAQTPSFGLARIVFDRDRLRANLSAALSAARRRVWRAAVPVVLAGFLGAFLLTGFLIRPLEDVVSGARAIGAGVLNHVIPVARRDEIGLLAGEFNRMAARLSELDAMKRDFVNGVTHDLKSPLAAILAAAEAARTDDRQTREEQLAAVRDRARTLRDLITSILEVAKIESGLVLNKKSVRVEDLVDRVVAAHRPEADRKAVALEHVLDAAPPPLSLDETKIERALGNLVGNAVKFTDKGAVVVRTGAEGSFAVVRVEDSGPGLPEELKERLFTKFARASRGEAAEKEGTGLGLAISKGIVEAHGGTITAESAPGRGAVFTVRLPRG